MNFKKDPLFILLILTLLSIGGSMCYYNRANLSHFFNGQSAAATSKNAAEKDVPIDHDAYTVNTIDTALYQNDSDYIAAQNRMRAIADTMHNPVTALKTPASAKAPETPPAAPVAAPSPGITSLVRAEDTPAFQKSYPEKPERPAIKETGILVSDNDNVICELKGNRPQKLIIYPNNNTWHSVYLIAPISDKKMLSKKNIIQPEYEGVNYPIYKQGKFTYKGKKYDVIQVTFPSTSVDVQHPYSIQLQSNPAFIIFGEQKNAEWSVYENGRVAKFNAPKDLILSEN